MDAKPPGSDPREVLGQCRPSPGPLAAGGGGGTRRAGHCYSSPGSSPDGKQKCPGVPWQSGQIPRGARWDRRGDPAALPLRRACSMPSPPPPPPPRLVPTPPPPPPPPQPPRPRPLPAHLPALLLALDRGGWTASQNAPPESGAQLAREPPAGAGIVWRRARVLHQDGTEASGPQSKDPLQGSVAGELPPFGVTGPRKNTVILLAPITTSLGLPVPAWPPCIQSPLLP
ncbi:ras-associated and pleckstrin homology domains-containing protein 1-like isoform X2 [Leopardus geoffroyi]|uniref:ras-associated and pleckstrin homology domains-containing protein 1-like isoform X2 n=1 Tax=Leopardus geoffroyi TaxID=46844 RepID=UPI001E26566B|nr:ras-associated and pleckstrin homology domains-containing protein 1-like isoform X2 [Leopardus geoffroyi]